jgi:hypothetical protein
MFKWVDDIRMLRHASDQGVETSACRILRTLTLALNLSHLTVIKPYAGVKSKSGIRYLSNTFRQISNMNRHKQTLQPTR